MIYHQRHRAGFAGAHVWYWPTQPILSYWSKTSAAAPVTLMALLRSSHRRVASRVWGRVN